MLVLLKESLVLCAEPGMLGFELGVPVLGPGHLAQQLPVYLLPAQEPIHERGRVLDFLASQNEYSPGFYLSEGQLHYLELPHLPDYLMLKQSLQELLAQVQALPAPLGRVLSQEGLLGLVLLELESLPLLLLVGLLLLELGLQLRQVRAPLLLLVAYALVQLQQNLVGIGSLDV